MFDILDEVSEPGSSARPNEDACGAAGAFAWVIDTSIFPGTAPFRHAASDAAWFAALANERFKALAPDARDGPGLARQVMQECREAYLDGAPPERHDFLAWPIGAITVVRAGEGALDAWTLGDTSAFLRQPAGPVLTLGEAPELRVFESRKAAELLGETGATPATIAQTPAFRAWLSARREKQRQGGGSALFGLRPEAAERMRHERVECPDGSLVLLTSDGFTALVDLYGAYDAASLLAAAYEGGLATLVAQARRIEEEDREGRRFPRFKVSDDATALLLEVRG